MTPIADKLVRRKIIRSEYAEDHLTFDRPRYKVLASNKEPEEYHNFKDVVIGEAVLPAHSVIKTAKHFGEIAMHLEEKSAAYNIDHDKLTDDEEDQLIIEQQIMERKEQRRFGHKCGEDA